MENKILNAVCASRECFDQILPHIKKKTFSDKGSIIFKFINDYYSADPKAEAVDKEILLKRLGRAHPKGEEVFNSVLETDYKVSPQNVLRELRDMMIDETKELMVAALSAHGEEDKLPELYQRYYDLTVENEDEETKTGASYNSRTLKDIATTVATENRIKLSPPELQAATGGALRGHHLLVFGRPDIGKSTFASELIYGFLSQGLTVMYVGNEDPPDDLMMRFACRLLGKNERTVMANMDKAEQALMARNWGNFWFEEMIPGTLQEIRARVEDVRPDVLIVDQVRNLDTRASDRTRELELVERGIRNLGKQYKMVTISFTQAGDSAEGKAQLGLSDVDSSKTGMQASADLMVGVGATDEDIENYIRWLSYPKNKLSGKKIPSRVKMNFDIFKVGG